MLKSSDLNKTKQKWEISQHCVILFSKERYNDKSKNLIYAATAFREKKFRCKENSKRL